MEDNLRKRVRKHLENKLQYDVIITNEEWEAAKQELFNDIYINRLCMLKDVSVEYTIHTLATIIIVFKKVMLLE
ncbi:MAG: hypothetical protein AB7G87_14465 [Clostridia bacterium]